MKRREKIDNQRIDKTLGLFGALSRQELEAAQERASRRFGNVTARTSSVNSRFVAVEPGTEITVPRGWRWRFAMVAGSAAVFLAVIIGAIVWRQAGSFAVVETADGSVYRIVNGVTQVIPVGEWLDAGQTVRTNGAVNAVLKLADGSRVEMRSQSELSLGRTEDGVQILLSNGGVIVNAAEQREGRHLYVQTKDVTVSVVGTVFLVNAEETGSYVAVIQGEVRVQGGAALRVLLPGEQVATASSREALPIAEEISWSRQALAHSTLLQQSAAAAGAAAPTRPEFEVSVVRANVSGSTSSRMEHKQDRVTISNATLEEIIRYAYSDRNARMSGPGLLRSGRYDIEAKSPSGTPDALLLPMLQTLLTDRFKMRLHRETIEMPVYALVVAKDGHKLKEVQPGGVSGAGSAITPRVDGLASTMFMGDMASFATSLSGRVDRPVVDQTRLSGRFNVALSYVPDRLLALGETPGPSIFSALQEQLGLKLEPQQGSIEMIVIDDIQEPNPN